MRILAVRFSAIGDCVMAAWPVTALREAMPAARIVWALESRCAPVVRCPGLADRVFALPREAWKSARWAPATWSSQVRSYLGLRGERFDVAFDFQGHSKTALLARLSGARMVVANRGTDAFARAILRPVQPPADAVHEVELGLSLVRSWAPAPAGLPMMPPSGPRVPRLITVQTGAGEARKAYPAESWAKVADLLAEEGFRVVLIGGLADPEPACRAESLVGRCTLAEAVDWVARSAVHLAADTGTGHVAAAYGVPAVSVFGPTDPARFRPYGRDVVVLRAPRPADVEPPDVAQAAAALSKEACGPRPH